ncbi:MAG: alpha/beta hydrolase [Longimicrobiales bacterium]
MSLLAGLATPQESAAQSFAGPVEVGPDRALWAECAGRGGPVVLLEAGAGSSAATWDTVWDELTALTRTCRYDRAGLGRSAPAPHSRPAGVSEPVDAVVADLEALIPALGIDGELVLVGHSAGGLYVRLYAHRHPDAVVGMVLVDALDERHRGRVLALSAPSAPEDARAWAEYVADQRRRQVRTADGEDEVVVLMRPARDLGDLPLEVLSAADPMGPPPEGFARGMIEQMEALWLTGQVALARMSADARHTVVEDTGHNLHRQRPDAVVAAVRRLVERARREP